MKPHVLKTLILMMLTALITALIMYFLCCKKKDITEVPDKDRSTTICADYSTQPPAVLTTDLIKSMVTKYDATQLDNIQNAASNAVPNDARAIWFDLETLKKFLYQVEHGVNTNYAQSQNKKIGIRIYYAAYPKNNDMRTFSTSQSDPNFTYNPAYENKHTLVMIPTIAGADGANYDFNPLDVNTYNGFVNMDPKNKYAFVNNTYSTLSLGPAAENDTTSGTGTSPSGTSARNHGTLTPPDSIIGFGF